ncbi:unnamed protein product [Polarella glacialis]|uniref:Uncharacterized protein n=1 Tax=Polarella glacialis TaxID=89957 RepID=A0A813I4X3_POLGL|nr:unnamed protein product [Polarella glacialis]
MRTPPPTPLVQQHHHIHLQFLLVGSHRQHHELLISTMPLFQHHHSVHVHVLQKVRRTSSQVDLPQVAAFVSSQDGEGCLRVLAKATTPATVTKAGPNTGLRAPCSTPCRSPVTSRPATSSRWVDPPVPCRS